MDLLVDGMVYRVWLRMSFTGEGRGQRSNRVVKATREDGAEEYGVIYVFENVFRRGGISNWTARLQLMPDVLDTTTKASRSEYDSRKNGAIQ